MRTRNKRVKSKQRSKANKKNTSKHTAKKLTKANKKNNSNSTIHQIFYNIGKGELKDIPAFKKCYDHNKKYCKKIGIKYKLWSEKEVIKLLNKPKNKEYRKLYNDFDNHPLGQPIQKIDFARYLILWNYGGIYIDLDICIIDEDDKKVSKLKDLFNKEYFFVRWDTSKLPYNALLGTQKGTQLYKDILDHCRESFYEKAKQDIYKQWKGRFVFQTTGHYMIQRVLKKHKINVDDLLNIMKIQNPGKRDNAVICEGKKPKCPNALFEDANVSVWYSGK